MAWLSGWGYRKKITVSATNVNEDLIDFPLGIPLSRSSMEGHHGVASGADVRFTASDGVTLLAHEWTGWSDDGYSGAFVKIPSLDSLGGASIYLYYGNVSASDATNKAQVWSDYVVAAHLDGFHDGQYESASGYSLTGNPSAPSASAGVVGSGVAMDGTKSIKVGSTGNVWDRLVGATGFSLSLCVLDVDYSTTNHTRLFYQDEWGQMVCCSFRLTNSGDLVFLWYPTTGDYGNIQSIAAAGVTAGDDIHVTATFGFSGGNAVIRTYKNGSQIGTASKASGQTVFPVFGTPTREFQISYPNYGLHGVFDEARIKVGAASAAWTKFEYANLMVGGNQLTLGSEESLPIVTGPYRVAKLDSFQTDLQQAETFIPGIIAGQSHGT